MFGMIPAEVRGRTGGRSWRMGSTWNRMRSNTGSRARLRTFGESVEEIIKSRRRRRSRGYSIHTSGGEGLPDFISFSRKLNQDQKYLLSSSGSDVWREMIEKETFEQETFILVNSVGQRE